VVGNSGSGGGGEEMGRRMNMVQTYIQVWCIWYIVRTFVNATMYPYPAKPQQNFF
jgi:hypothetical protein